MYNYTDHLGNVRLSYAKNGAGTEIIEESNYYPFGLKHEGYNVLLGNSAYKYKYNCKELQESGMYDYGARFYMPDLGRWGVVDPLAEKYQELSPFRYSFNNPVNFVDPVGLTEEDPPSKKGNSQKVTEIGEITLIGKKSNWIQKHVINPIATFFKEEKRKHDAQPQVLPPINTFWSHFYNREWESGGVTYLVARDGKISMVKPIGGAGPLEYISGAGELKYLLASKEGLETFKSTEIAAQSTEKVQKLAKLMKEGDISIYGEKIVVYLKDGERYILDGHHRIQAAIQENKTLEVIEVTGQKAMQMFKDKVKQIDSGLFK